MDTAPARTLEAVDAEDPGAAPAAGGPSPALYAPLGAPQRRSSTRQCFRVAAPAAAVALLLLAAAWASLRGPGRGTAVAALSSKVQLKELGGESMKPLLIEGNLAALLTDQGSAKEPGKQQAPAEFEPPRSREACRDQAGRLFDLVAASGLHRELLGDELGAFRARFVGALDELCAGQRGGGELTKSRWMEAAKDALESQKPVMTQAYADALNSRGLSFRVEMRDWMADQSMASFRRQRLGRAEWPADLQDVVRHEYGDAPAEGLPAEFDSRDKWPDCKGAIERILNQGTCGNCYVFAAMGSIEARLCIASQGAFGESSHVLSRGQATSCSVVDHDGCQGGSEVQVLQWADKSPFGISSDRCVGYFGTGEGVDHFQRKSQAPPCPAACRKEYPRSMQEDYFMPTGVGKYSLLMYPNRGKKEKLEMCKRAVYEGGPIAFGIYATPALLAYTSGVYKVCGGQKPNHAAHFIGWGEENGEGYMLAKNSWGPKWGLNGHFHAAFCEMTDCTIPGEIRDAKMALPLAEFQTSPHRWCLDIPWLDWALCL